MNTYNHQIVEGGQFLVEECNSWSITILRIQIHSGKWQSCQI